MRKLSLFVAVIGFAAVMVACGDNAKKGNFTALTAHPWQLDQVVYTDNTLEAPANVYANFTDTLFLSGRGGCNGFFGSYQASAETDSISIGQLGSTMMYCPNMEFETTFFNLLEQVTNYNASATVLELEDSEKTFKMVFSPKTEDAVIEDQMIVENDTLAEAADVVVVE